MFLYNNVGGFPKHQTFLPIRRCEVCEYCCTLIKRQFCDIDFWTFALISWGSFCPRHPVFGFVSARPCRIISHLEAGPGTAIMWLNIKEEVGRADTELIIHIIIQVIKCNFHNIHNMWQGLTSDFLGYNSKLRPIPAEYSGLIVDIQYQELLGILCGIIAEPHQHQRRNLPVYILSQKISKDSLDEEWCSLY